MKSAHHSRNTHERPFLLMFLGVLGCLGCLSMIAGTVAAQIIVPDHDWIADTISDLGAGRWEIVMDTALYGFAAGLLATSLAAAHAHQGRVGWSVGVVSLAVIAVLVIVVGARNEYGDGDQDGVVLHMYFVYALGAMFLLTPLSMAAGVGDDHPRGKMWLIGLGVAWGLMTPVFLASPNWIDGLLERALGLVACGIVVVLSITFFKRGRCALTSGAN